MPLISFQCIFSDSGVLLSGFSNFYKLRMGDLISGVGEPVLQNVWIIWLPLQYLKTKSYLILRHSLDFSPLYMNEEDFSQSPEISTN